MKEFKKRVSKLIGHPIGEDWLKDFEKSQIEGHFDLKTQIAVLAEICKEVDALTK